jgi:hypothetical protein
VQQFQWRHTTQHHMPPKGKQQSTIILSSEWITKSITRLSTCAPNLPPTVRSSALLALLLIKIQPGKANLCYRCEIYWCHLSIGGSVAAKFEVTAYSILAPGQISNLCIFEYTYVYSNIHGRFMDEYRIWTPFSTTP